MRHMKIPEDKLQAIREAIQGGPEHKIAAIKLVCEATGCGLAEAKSFVENFPSTSVSSATSDGLLKNIPEDKRHLVLEAIYAGPERKIAAIKMVREAANLGLAEAKEFVEKLGAELYAKEPAKFRAAPTIAKGGCFGMVVAVAVTLGATVFVLMMVFGR